MKRYSSTSSGTTSSHSIRGSSLWIAAKTTKARTFTQKVMPIATEAESGIKIGSKRQPPKGRASLDDRRQHRRHGVDEEQEEENPDQEEEREVLRLVGGFQQMGEDEPEHAEVRERFDERPDIPESRIGVPGLEVDGADDAQDAEVVRDATRGSGLR